MRLVGVPNSPYFRRTAISMELLEVPFEVEALSPFIDVEAIRAINPVIKVPSLICDDGGVIMDSSLILEFVEAALAQGRTLWPANSAELQRDFRAVSLALSACDKSIQVVYETRLRPQSTQHPPWLERIQGQLAAAFDALEVEVVEREAAFASGFSQAGISAAVAWGFAQLSVPGAIDSGRYSALPALSQRMESSEVFKKYAVRGIG